MPMALRLSFPVDIDTHIDNIDSEIVLGFDIPLFCGLTAYWKRLLVLTIFAELLAAIFHIRHTAWVHPSDKRQKPASVSLKKSFTPMINHPCLLS
ncbi:MAG: hypothetical protein LWX01_06045 [Deltaproteobacteria bacterium]|nr:hypothetical protein [Deltaproteobacteria bacterium]MDL1961248.1 hypothetical protein [Deltaproteobacteria bacterium]